MKLLGKIILGLVLFVVVVIAAAVVILPQVVDPNDYKPLITQEAQKATGRELKLEGELKLSVFPWLGVQLGKTSLGAAPGFGPQPMVSLNSAQVRVKIMPLLLSGFNAVELDTVVLEKPVIRAGIAKNGATAWDDILAKLETPETAETKPEETPAESGQAPQITIGGVEIRDGLLEWTDAQQGTSYIVRDLNVNVDQLVEGEPVGVRASCGIKASQPQLDAKLEAGTTLTAKNGNQLIEAKNAELTLTINDLKQPDGTSLQGTVSLAAQAVADLAKTVASLSGLDLRLDLQGSALPSGSLAGGLQAPEARVNWGAGTADVDSFALTMLGVTATGGLKASNLNTSPAASGSIKLDTFSPRQVLKALGQDIPTQDPKALSTASADVSFKATENSLALPKLTAQLDDTTLLGNLSVADFAKPNIAFDLTMDSLDADRYMPPEGQQDSGPQSGGTPEPAAGQDGTAAEDPLKALTVNGTAKIGKLKAMKVHMQDIRVTVKGKNGVFNVDPLSAKLYEGTLTGKAKATLGQEIGPSDVDMNLSGFSIGPFLEDYLGGFGWVGGKTDFVLNANTQGGADPLTTLNGAGNVIIKHGVLYGFTLVPGAVSSLLGGGQDAFTKSNSTKFDQLGGNFALKQGQVDFKKLFLIRDGERIESEGADVDLVKQKLNIPMTMLSDKLPATKGVQLDKLPLALTGSFDNPTLGVDPEALKEVLAGQLQGKAKEILGDKLQIPGLSGSSGGTGEAGGTSGGSSGGSSGNVGDAIKKGLGGLLGGGKK